MVTERAVELVVISAQDLKRVTNFGQQSCYAVAYVDSGQRSATRVDKDGGLNPTWNSKLTLSCDESLLLQPGRSSCITVEVYSHGSFSDKLVGSVTVPLLHVATEAKTQKKVMALEVRRPSGNVRGVLNVSVKLREKGKSSTETGKHCARSSSDAHSSIAQQQLEEVLLRNCTKTQLPTCASSKVDPAAPYLSSSTMYESATGGEVYPPDQSCNTGARGAVLYPPRNESSCSSSSSEEPSLARPSTDYVTSYLSRQCGQQYASQCGRQSRPQQYSPSAQANAPYSYQQAYYSKPPKKPLRGGGGAGLRAGLPGGASRALLIGDLIGDY